jgi:CRISPR-associated helicase Cas3
MQLLNIDIEPLSFEQTTSSWLSDLRPYVYQDRAYTLVEQALDRRETLCLFLVTSTGSGKTLASYASAINNGLPALGVYPTNELIRDQERALKPWLDPQDNGRLLRIDSKQLDDWQVQEDLRQHATTLERLLMRQPTILTNPDILFHIVFGLYQGVSGLSQRLITLIGQYQIFVFDEFHLYNVKQMADMAFFVATLHAINPKWGRVFVFASATPESPARTWLEQQLSLPVQVIEGEPSEAPDARVIAQPVKLTILPANLHAWKGDEVVQEFLPELRSFITQHPQARLVTILDSVAGAIRLASTLRDSFPGISVGEIHGFSSEQERSEALTRQFTIGTSTIEVGIDFKDTTGKDVLMYEARTSSQFIQRFGRLARHEKDNNIPNWTIALVPEYVYHFLAERLGDQRPISRRDLHALIDEAYQKPEDFARFLRTHAPAEFHAARMLVQSLFQADVRPRIVQGMETAIQALTTMTGNQASGIHRRYDSEKILKPLLSFRGSGFDAAIVDERGSDPGFSAKRYNLMLLLRRGLFEEIEQDEYTATLDRMSVMWPEDAAREKRYGSMIKLGAEELLGVFGYFRLGELLDKGRKVWFEAGQEIVSGRKAQVTTISGLQIRCEPEVRIRQLNRFLSKKQFVTWFIDRHPASIKLGKSLPPMFELHELRVRLPGGALADQRWTIAFNQDAFFVDSLGWWKDKREDTAIIL